VVLAGLAAALGSRGLLPDGAWLPLFLPGAVGVFCIANAPQYWRSTQREEVKQTSKDTKLTIHHP
jgi:hypothetical protein